MANVAAYSGLRWGELTALTISQVDASARTITVDRKVVEVAGHLYVEAPKNRKRRRTIYPREGTRWRTSSPPGSGPPARSRRQEPTRSVFFSRLRGAVQLRKILHGKSAQVVAGFRRRARERLADRHRDRGGSLQVSDKGQNGHNGHTFTT
jgi:integrase